MLGQSLKEGTLPSGNVELLSSPVLCLCSTFLVCSFSSANLANISPHPSGFTVGALPLRPTKQVFQPDFDSHVTKVVDDFTLVGARGLVQQQVKIHDVVMECDIRHNPECKTKGRDDLRGLGPLLRRIMPPKNNHIIRIYV